MQHLTRTLAAYAADLGDRVAAEEDGFSTAELLGNAALGILALVAIWGALQLLGLDIVDFVRGQLVTGG
jgi:hypothetical protein